MELNNITEILNQTTMVDTPSHDILVEDIHICPIDDHQTMGISSGLDFSSLNNQSIQK